VIFFADDMSPSLLRVFQKMAPKDGVLPEEDVRHSSAQEGEGETGSRHQHLHQPDSKTDVDMLKNTKPTVIIYLS
jgi:hypothetical protein